jgi:cytochrome oxidase assembly protein ShyY1
MLRRWHTPSLLAWALLALGLVAFTSLGTWQWSRAAQKETLLAAFADAEHAPPRPFDVVVAEPAPPVHPRVSVRGRFVADRGYLLDEQMRAGRVGVLAFAVFEPEGSQLRLLVNRGWHAWSHTEGGPPVLPLLPAGTVELRGLYAPPPGGGLRVGGNALATQSSWPKLALYLDLREVADDLGGGVYPRVLLLDADPTSGFVREWTPALMPPERHRGYAVQWWSFALVSLAIFIALHWRKPSSKSST